ncbi:MAG: hypothetical protein JOZ72_03500 [Alphaproteobacteria bacterium]|nr:hypothetical protein [Alphaproteobacteria bacterium]
MAKYFFNFRQGASYQVDDQGCEFDSVEEAYLGAFTAAQDMWRELLIKRQDPLLCTFEVMDEEGRDLFSLPFVEILDVCRGRINRPVHIAPRPHYVHQAMENRAAAMKMLGQVSSTVADARATLRETWSLLAQVGRIVGE